MTGVGGGVPAPTVPSSGLPFPHPDSVSTRCVPPAAFGENMEKEDGVEEGGVLPVGAARVAEAWGLFKAPQGSVPGGGSRDLIAPLPFAGVSAASGLAPVFIHSG